MPGELFVHRNIANVVVHTDLNCLSVLQYAVDVLRVRHVIVCGHYGCGGVLAALRGDRLGLIDNWLRHVQDVRDKYRHELDACGDEAGQHRRLCELNVVEQVVNVARTTIVRDAWGRRPGRDDPRLDIRGPRRTAPRFGYVHWRQRRTRRVVRPLVHGAGDVTIF